MDRENGTDVVTSLPNYVGALYGRSVRKAMIRSNASYSPLCFTR